MFEFVNRLLLPKTDTPDLPVVVSLTSFPPRMPFLQQTLKSLLLQSLKPEKILVYLSKEEFAQRPEILKPFEEQGVDIRLVPGNIRSYKKLIYALQDFPEHIIVTCDDDVLYGKDMLKKLYASYKKYPNDISCHRSHRIRFAANGQPLPYKNWNFCIRTKIASFTHVATGIGGVLYPPHCLYRDVTDFDKFLKLAPTCDDLWFWAMEVLNGTKIRVVPGAIRYVTEIPGSENEAAAQLHENNNVTGNDIQLAKIVSAYPELLQKVQECLD